MKRHRILRCLVLISVLLTVFSGTSWAQPAEVSGLVLDAEDLTPVAGLTIVLESAAVSLTVTTDAGGYYSFQGIPAGDYELYVSSDEYLKLPKPVTVFENLATVVNLGAIPVEVLDQTQEATSAGTENTAAAQTWKGNWRDDEGVKNKGKLTLNAEFSGKKINGTMTATNTGGCGTLTFPCSGSLSGTDFHLQGKITNQCLGGKLKFVFDGALSPSGTKITGDLESYKGNTHQNHYTFTLNKK
jgi:hypothetical protein